MKLWEALYNPMIHESGFVTISIHLTKRGAQKAIERDKQREYEEWLEEYKWIPNDQSFNITWDKFKIWKVQPIKLKL
jgi:hypothetical protein